VTDYGPGGQGSIPYRCKTLLFSIAFRPALGPTQSPNHRIVGSISLGIKQLGHEADHSPPSSGEVKNGGAIPPISHTTSWLSA
jgi:hypothetical protein